jgi:hypothetical protein
MLIPFLFIYLHNVRGIGLAVAGLVVGTNAVVGVAEGAHEPADLQRLDGARQLRVEAPEEAGHGPDSNGGLASNRGPGEVCQLCARSRAGSFAWIDNAL